MNERPDRFRKGIAAINLLAEKSRYHAAFVFGSVAEGTSNVQSDLDVKVIVDEDNLCENINHPIIDNYKLDITFRSFRQIKEFTENEIKSGDREPNLVRAMIIFDKTGELTNLQQEIQAVVPKKYTKKDHQFVQFMLYHANNKVERALQSDPAASLYSMHANIGEVLKIHFKLNGKWWVSSKNVLTNLETWDPELAATIKCFINASGVQEKYAHWTTIVDHVAAGLGGRQPIAENNCNCKTCRADLRLFLAAPKVSE